MYAVVRTGGKQYRVAEGQTLEVEYLPGETGEKVDLNEVLMLSDGDLLQVGHPLVEGAAVHATITGQHKGRKIEVFRYKPKKRVRVRRGHRQALTRLQVDRISTGGDAS